MILISDAKKKMFFVLTYLTVFTDFYTKISIKIHEVCHKSPEDKVDFAIKKTQGQPKFTHSWVKFLKSSNIFNLALSHI